MSRAVRVFLSVLFMSGMSVFSGCGNKNEGQPNTALQIPDIEPSSRGDKKSKLTDPANEPKK